MRILVRMKERLFFFAFCFFLACEYHSDILPGGRLGLGDICGVASFGLADRDGVGDAMSFGVCTAMLCVVSCVVSMPLWFAMRGRLDKRIVGRMPGCLK